MQDKTKKKKEKNEIKVQDLKPVKDPKGGLPPPCGPGSVRSEAKSSASMLICGAERSKGC